MPADHPSEIKAMSDIATPTSSARAADLDIRRAHSSEYPAIGDLTVAAYAARYGALTADYTVRLRHPEARADESDIWVATEPGSGRLVGTLSVRKDLIDGELIFEVLASAAEHGKQGIGTALLEHVFTLARSRGVSNVGMYSGSTMTAAHAFYTKHGFEREHGRELEFLEDGVPISVWKFTRAVPQQNGITSTTT